MHMNSRLHFIVLLFVVVAVSFAPVLRWPFNWLETYFHELSHGLAALFTGGRIQYIELHFQGSGLCVTAGGWQVAIAFAGYFGAVFWGVAIYKTVTATEAQVSRLLTAALLLTLLTTTVLWVRDINTLIIAAILFMVFLGVFKYGHGLLLKTMMQFSGLYVLTNAIRSPLALLDGKSIGDGANLAILTWVPEGVWIAVWIFISIIGLWMVWPPKEKNIKAHL